jgi:lipoprotein-releasing system permease protein
MLFNLIFAPVFVILASAQARNWQNQWAMNIILVLLGLILQGLSYPVYIFFTRPYVISLFPKDVYYLDRIPCEVSYPTIALIVGMTILVSIVASIYPAYRAASYDPVEAIRRE